MKSLSIFLLWFALLAGQAAADWRWADPEFKKHKFSYSCNSFKCIKHTYLKEKRRLRRKITRYHNRRRHEWRHWTSLYIPACTWYGESGYGPEYARYRYTMPNASGSGAYGKYQFMPATYHNRAKYHDWSALDQELAARREYWANGTTPWTNC
jgi:hypothetical protein